MNTPWRLTPDYEVAKLRSDFDAMTRRHEQPVRHAVNMAHDFGCTPLDHPPRTLYPNKETA